MSKSLFGLWRQLPPALQLRVERWWFERISALDGGEDFFFMNYGYARLDSGEEAPVLRARDEKHRYGIQLYHRVANVIPWHGSVGLEVGCGHGGGTAYVMRYLQPRSLIALDLTANAIRFCTRHHSLQGLSFLRGHAESLPFSDNVFDVVLNIESSLLYRNVAQFFREVVRILKPNGTFLYADYRKKLALDQWDRQLKGSGLDLITAEDISANVAEALRLDRQRKQQVIDRYVPRILHDTFSDFAGLKDGNNGDSQLFKNGEQVYRRFVFRKMNRS